MTALEARIAWRPCAPDGSIASARLRAFIPVAQLRAAGWNTSILAPDQVPDHDCVVFQKPYGVADVELCERLAASGTKIVVDICDNYFTNPDRLPELDARADRLRRMVELADVVTVSTPGLAELLPGTRAFHVDDAVEDNQPTGMQRVAATLRNRWVGRSGRPARLVWFGNSGSPGLPYGMRFLSALLPSLARLHQRLPIHLTVISNDEQRFNHDIAGRGVPARFLPWRLDTFGRDVMGHDVTLLPVGWNDFTVHKTNNRLVQSLMLGVPVVCDHLPSYDEFAEWVLFADWEQSIQAYVTGDGLRARHVEGARAHIRSTYSPARLTEQWGRALTAALSAEHPQVA